MKTLVQLGADIHLKDSNQRNILHMIVTRGGNIEEFAETVRQVGINLFVLVFVFHLQICIIFICNKLFLFLKAQGIEKFKQLLDEKNNQGSTPLHCACEGGYIKSLESLLKYGAGINLKNNDKETPLHLAAR